MQIKILVGLAIACALAQGPAAHAQGAPIHIVVPLASGGGPDVLARLSAAKMLDSLGQKVVVENRAGAAGTIRADAVYRAKPFGPTVLFTRPGPLVVNQW